MKYEIADTNVAKNRKKNLFSVKMNEMALRQAKFTGFHPGSLMKVSGKLFSS